MHEIHVNVYTKFADFRSKVIVPYANKQYMHPFNFIIAFQWRPNGREKTDTKFSWFILTMVTFIVFLEAGIVKAFAVLLPDLKEHLSSQTWIIGSCISIIYGLGFVTG